MANTFKDTGHGASLTFGTSAHSFDWTSIELGEISTTAIQCTKLADTNFHSKLAGDLKDAGSITCSFYFDAGTALPAVGGAAETLTVTFPVPSGGSGAATYAGTGFIESLSLPSLTTDEMQTASMTFTWDGGTDPTFTVGT